MKERPIIFSGPLVRALLSGAKTQTRRVVKPQPGESGYAGIPECDDLGEGRWQWNWGPGPRMDGAWFNPNEDRTQPLRCPYGKPGDRLWVREAWSLGNVQAREGLDPALGFRVTYKADAHKITGHAEGQRLLRWDHPDASLIEKALSQRAIHEWRSPMFMPRWASRLTLEIESVRVERLQEISEEDAEEEGVCETLYYHDGERLEAAGSPMSAPRYAFRHLWTSIHGADPVKGWDANPWVWVIGFRGVTP